MKPERIKMTHQLIVNYGLYKQMTVYEPHNSTNNELCGYHSQDYINYIEFQSKKQDTQNSTIGNKCLCI